MGGAWAVPLRSGLCDRQSWGGTDATEIRDEECAPKSSVVRTYLEGVVRVVRARRPTGGAPAISLLLWSPL